MLKSRRVILLGPPGTGKGTQAKRLALAAHALQIATGDLLRDAISRGTPLGKQVHPIMRAGGLVPDEVVVGLIEQTLEAASDRGEIPVIFDGFPRTIAQAQSLDVVLAKRGWALDRVVLIQSSDDAIVDRISTRRNCPQCGEIFNLKIKPPRQEGTCDNCGEGLVQREDDKPETVRARLRKYWSETAPLVDLYRARGILSEVDGNQTVDEVFTGIAKATGLRGYPVAGSGVDADKPESSKSGRRKKIKG